MRKQKKISMTTQIIIATAGGIIFGALVGPWAGNLKFIGDMFIRLIQMTVVVLVMTSVIAAMGDLKGKSAGKIGFHTLKWILIFTILSALLGLGLGMLMQPGTGMQAVSSVEVETQGVIGIQETLLNFISSNIIQSMANGDMIPCIIFALFFGVCANKYVQESKNTVISDWIKALNEITLRIIQVVMKVSPIGIFCLLANVAGAIGFKVVIPMLKYLGVLALGDIIIMVIFSLFTAMRCGINPLLMPKKFAKMSILALTTTSSAICFPTVLEDSIEKFGIRKKTADFVLPLGMSMCSCGAAMSNVCVILFMAQAGGVTMSLPQIILGIGLSCMLCMGTITVPGGFAVSATFLASSLGLPAESVALMLGVDWFAGMFRTFTNVNVDVLVALLVDNMDNGIDKDIYNGKKQIKMIGNK